ncbi:MAG: aminopeptidase [Clostridiales bacterium]|jgi:aspartyl aminopeptidase|nr:aminopeptidase [Clostridiales bacterium]
MELKFERKNVWENLNETERKLAYEMGDDYRAFIDAGKTERLSANEIVKRAKAGGFKCFDEYDTLKAGDKVYYVNRGKAVVLAVIGKRAVKQGLNIVGSHTDSPRVDIKQNPLYEEKGLSLFKTHYYGGVRKYQWVGLPLALYGTVVKGDGSIVEIALGDNHGDPVLYMSDLLPHLGAKQGDKKLREGIEGEDLNVIVGCNPVDNKGDEKNAVKLNVLRLLNEKYGIVEEDFASAELEIVPAGRARDVGFDRSMIAAYGHDDRVCAYASMQALFDANEPEITAVALFADKEEIGSVGNTGMQSEYFTYLVAEMIAKQNNGNVGLLELNRALSKSTMLSADVAAGIDPTFSSVFEAQNSAFMGSGAAMIKYTGVRGKSGASDANAEFIGRVRKVFNDSGVIWQTSELGRVDEGGGGTIAFILANHNVDVLDVGIPVLSMHATYELVAKSDIYMGYKAYRAYYEGIK